MARRWAGLAEMPDREWWRWLGAIALLAAALRVGLVALTPHFVLWGDPTDYQRHAASIAAGHGMGPSLLGGMTGPSAYRPPAYPYLLGGVYAVTGLHLTVGRLLSAALGVLTVILVSCLGRSVWDTRIGLLAGALAAVFLPLIALNASLLSESLFLPVELALALCLVMVARSGASLRWTALAGALCALAALTRTVGAIWLLPLVVVVGMVASAPQVALVSTAAAVCAFALVLAPWTIRNAEAFHQFVPISTQDGFTAAGQYNELAGRSGPFRAVWQVPLGVPSLRDAFQPLIRNPYRTNEAQLDGRLRAAAISYVSNHPSAVPIAVWLNSLRLLDLGENHQFTTAIAYREMALPHSVWVATTVSAQLAAVLALLALLAAAWGRLAHGRAAWRSPSRAHAARRLPRMRLGPWWLWSLPVLATAFSVAFDGTPRYRAPADPFLLLLAALTINGVVELVAARRAGAADDSAVPATVS